jgi:hypothetical protein
MDDDWKGYRGGRNRVKRQGPAGRPLDCLPQFCAAMLPLAEFLTFSVL